MTAVSPVAAQRSPGESRKSPSPPKLTPQQRVDLAKREYDAAGRAMVQIRQQIADAVRAVSEAESKFDDAAERTRKELVSHPALADAGKAIIEARAALAEAREKALRPLRASAGHQENINTLAAARDRLYTLREARLEADRKRLPFAKEDVATIYAVSEQVLRLEDEIAAAEAETLDDHAGYKEAVAGLEKAMTEAAATMKDVTRLVRDGPALKGALTQLQQSYAQLAAANKASRDARARRDKAAIALGQALAAL